MTNIEMLEKTLPVAPLKLIAMESCQALGQKVNDYIVSFRENTINEVTESPLYINYKSNNYLVDCSCPRFGSGEAKGVLKETIRGTDLFIMTDVCNYSHISLIRAADRTILMGHAWGDLDAIGAAAGLCGAIRAIGADAYVFSDTNPTKEDFNYNDAPQPLFRRNLYLEFK